MADRLAEYRAFCLEDIEECLNTMECAPVLFIGSGFSQRYFEAPTWISLLDRLATACPIIPQPLAFYRQKHPDDLPQVAQEFVPLYHQWAWSDKDKHFDPGLFNSEEKEPIFLKSECSELIRNITPNSLSDIREAKLREELRLFSKIRPSCLITTNYDQFLEMLLPEYRAVVGEQIIQADTNALGDIYKIHGCVSDPSSLVLTKSDYKNYTLKRKYLSAKLLTLFTEFPIFIFGYSVNDPNVRALLSDIDEILAPEGNVIPNIFFLKWTEDERPQELAQTEVSISVGPHKHVRLKQITTSEFGWLFDCLSRHSPVHVRVDVLRRVLSRATRLIRKDIMSGFVEVNFRTIEDLDHDENESLRTVFGVARIDDPNKVNMNFPFTLTQVGKALGFSSWHKADDLIKLVTAKHGHDIKTTDNVYHVHIRTGERGSVHKYSKQTVDLLKAIKEEQDYTFLLQ